MNVDKQVHHLHGDKMRANYVRLEMVSADLLRWIADMESQHEDYYLEVLSSMEQSPDDADWKEYAKTDRAYQQKMSSLQAARERIIECSAHLKNAIVKTNGDNAFIENVTEGSFYES